MARIIMARSKLFNSEPTCIFFSGHESRCVFFNSPENMLGIRRPSFKKKNLRTIQGYHANRRALATCGDPIFFVASVQSPVVRVYKV